MRKGVSAVVLCILLLCVSAGVVCLVSGFGGYRAGADEALFPEEPETGASAGGNSASEGPAQEISAQETSAQETSAVCFEVPGSRYAYSTLTAAEKIWYQDINKVLSSMEERQELSMEGIGAGLDETDIDRIFQCVLSDHPEYFYAEGYTYTKYTRLNGTVYLEFSGNYSMDSQEAERRRKQIEAEADELLNGLASGKDELLNGLASGKDEFLNGTAAEQGEEADTWKRISEYDRVKYVYEEIIRGTEYDLNVPDHQNIYSVFVRHRSVCQGYAKAVQYLLNRLGVECCVVMGTVDTGESHAWNLVRVDGEYYYLDATWGDASYRMEDGEEDSLTASPRMNYDYFCVPAAWLLRTHSIGSVVPMPQCSAVEANYYVREGAYCTEMSVQQLETVFRTAEEEGRKEISLKCADRNTYDEMSRHLIQEQGIFGYPGIEDGDVAYALNEKQLSMTFWVTNDE